MRFGLTVKGVLLLCVRLLHTIVVSKNVCTEQSHFVRKKYHQLRGVCVHFLLSTPRNNVARDKYALRREWSSAKLCNRAKCSKKRQIMQVSFGKGSFQHDESTFQRGNILSNKKMKLIIRQLNRTKWYDFKFFSPAKVNLFLRLKERKETHNELSTLMHAINLGDDIFITALSTEEQKKLTELLFPCRSGDFLTIQKDEEHEGEHKNEEMTPGGKEEDTRYYYNHYPLNDDNIIAKVLRRYREELDTRDNVKFLIHVVKRTPIFSGIGGGSSNGASLFYFLEKYYYRYLKSNQLRNEFLKTIGSDISFFSSSGFAYCTGKGNNVIDLSDAQATISGRRIYIFQISEGLSSRTVYQNVDYGQIVQYNPVSLLKRFIVNGESCNAVKHVEEAERSYLKRFVPLDGTSLMNSFVNDLEHSAFALLKKVKCLKDLLLNRSLFDAVTMSGSGSSLFALTKKNMSLDEEKMQMKNLIKQVREKLRVPLKVYLCSALRKKENLWYRPGQLAERVA
ncbi:4-diphosphocytidyl-2c-methyl-D-erythritol kinase (CMK), putative [Plasmodium vivax]|uniref:4-diphosphocytidyl-2c-methyl-D-erythritol kinase (CMK), putative n=1 Tax=Plasmodium vivax (strain Salvador I) TaxID=126793 RepID=A5KAU8_PLAVS|nr:4-diphosphocytidyl-2c-methyl-D-erythritol kinase (CMK), putative [Plasmodium vivax]EDL43465.1 4-diphosphocytidyl-2c-methyl-D-erythritol kinase (CMK), putative [Plasmodium vivax]|eukprot:XP_001613192.1 4-diphosphocytidyl-2c-methyl-D-erythritol kinase (CMK) [Plasmodium vivax Sal-1]